MKLEKDRCDDTALDTVLPIRAELEHVSINRHGQAVVFLHVFFFFSSRRRHTRCLSDWSSDVCSSDLYWAPPLRIAVRELLDRSKHPFYANADAEFFLAMRDGRAVGRVAAIIDRNYNKFHDEQAGFFGFFEAENDSAVASALLLQIGRA